MGNQTAGRNELNQPKNLKEFWLFYVAEHLNPVTRFLHGLGTTLGIILMIAALLAKVWVGVLLFPLVAYGFAWTSHFLIEKNKPATFKYPLWSLICDFIMLYKTYNNTMEKEVAKVKQMKGLASLLFCVFYSFSSMALQDDDGYYERLKRESCERVQDFHDRQRKNEAWEVEKNRGAAEVKQKREAEAREMEIARLEQVEWRKRQVDSIAPLEAAHLQQQKEEKRKELEIERDFSRRMDRLHAYEKSHCKIPENEEYGLE